METLLQSADDELWSAMELAGLATIEGWNEKTYLRCQALVLAAAKGYSVAEARRMLIEASVS